MPSCCARQQTAWRLRHHRPLPPHQLQQQLSLQHHLGLLVVLLGDSSPHTTDRVLLFRYHNFGKHLIWSVKLCRKHLSNIYEWHKRFQWCIYIYIYSDYCSTYIYFSCKNDEIQSTKIICCHGVHVLLKAGCLLILLQFNIMMICYQILVKINDILS